MGAFEEKQSAGKEALPQDLPNAAESASKYPDGAIFRSDSKKRYRLRHARWVEVVARKPKDEAKKK